VHNLFLRKCHTQGELLQVGLREVCELCSHPFSHFPEILCGRDGGQSEEFLQACHGCVRWCVAKSHVNELLGIERTMMVGSRINGYGQDDPSRVNDLKYPREIGSTPYSLIKTGANRLLHNFMNTEKMSRTYTLAGTALMDATNFCLVEDLTPKRNSSHHPGGIKAHSRKSRQ
jgi:hypothetical protein